MKRIHDKLGTAGLIVAVVALVAAVGGSAIAATNATDSKRHHKRAKKNKKKQKGVTVAQVRKIAKQEASKYANSNPGPAGPQGPAGADGQNGSNGQNGADGAQGTAGEDGESVTMEPAGAECLSGGTNFQVGGEEEFVCNGEPGEPGILHPGETLPEGATETGGWRLQGATTSWALSFAIPLAEALPEANTHYVTSATADCPGSAAEPEAASGHLCVYEGFATGAVSAGIVPLSAAPGFAAGADTAGAWLVAEGFAGLAIGTYAVTG
jgi:Collagen triple helix repeat (20 copies)